MTTNYWEHRKVALLGGASLIGTHLAKRLLLENPKDLWVVDDLSAGKAENIDCLGVELDVLDLREPGFAADSVRGADVVFDLAAQHGGRGYVATHDVELYDNLSLDTTIFRACAQEGVEKVIFSSSACAYPVGLQTDSDQMIYLREDMIDYHDMRQADGPYGTEKLVGEQVLDAYIARGYFAGCSTRSFTVYGPLMGESHAIAALIAKVMLKQNPLEVWGTGRQIRNWTFVEDNVDGALLAAENLDRGAINIGIEDRLTPLYALEYICDIMGWNPDLIICDKDKPMGPANRTANCSKLKSLGWRPHYTFRQGLEKTIEWYLNTHTTEELRENFERKLTER